MHLDLGDDPRITTLVMGCRSAKPVMDAPFSMADLDYDLPRELIAQRPAPRRDDARLLLVGGPEGGLRDACVKDLPDLLQPEDLLVLNDTKVLPARFAARRQTRGAVSGLFLEETSAGEWRVMLRGSRRLRVGERLEALGAAGESVSMELVQSCGAGVWIVRVDAAGSPEELLGRIGRTPLPPYIRRRDGVESVVGEPAQRCRQACTSEAQDRVRYQTVYAKRPGAVAAPTAGLHLTLDLLEAIRARRVSMTSVTLHVGVGTFKAIGVDNPSLHVMHAERFWLTNEAAEAINECRRRGGRVVAVGTTSVRVLESAALHGKECGFVAARQGTTRLFIYPPYKYHVVDVMLTNFHLPRTTLLALVMAMAGVETIHQAYRHAIEKAYRFYSFGDAMLVHCAQSARCEAR
ncbi:MAG: tRNA preQ1(34) S-adenosylmethionine ribosyltransferase-isomerase QueA [Phycisphaerae bacterium]